MKNTIYVLGDSWIPHNILATQSVFSFHPLTTHIVTCIQKSQDSAIEIPWNIEQNILEVHSLNEKYQP